ncbi:MAG: hypothetical protein U0744_18030 [Gemmataceae bacterium]
MVAAAATCTENTTGCKTIARRQENDEGGDFHRHERFHLAVSEAHHEQCETHGQDSLMMPSYLWPAATW